MRKIIIYIFTLIMVLFITACDGSINENSIKIISNFTELEVGEVYQLEYDIDNSEGLYVHHITSDRDIAFIDYDGLIYVVGEGSVTFTVQFGNVSDSISVTTKNPLPLDVQAVIAAIESLTYPFEQNDLTNIDTLYQALTLESQSLVNNYSKYQTAVNDFQAAQAVIDLINAFTSPLVENDVTNARQAYDALSDNQKLLVSNIQALNDAEKAFLDAQTVIDMIAAFTDPMVVADVIAAQTAFDALSDAAKPLVTNATTLSDYFDAQEVVSMIIPFESDTLPSEEDYRAAVTAYNALTDIEKALVYNYQTLSNLADNFVNLLEERNAINVSNSFGLTYIKSIDFDGDGDIDVVGVAPDQRSIVYYENIGVGLFVTHVILTDQLQLWSIELKDVDGDTDVDIVVGGNKYQQDANIFYYENLGNLTFNKTTITTAALDSIHVEVSDIDEDGDMDILATSNSSDLISWFENDGNENFTEHLIANNKDGATFATAIDFDQDGDIDIVASSRFDGQVMWYENDGSESFTEHSIFTYSGTFPNPDTIKVLDYDQDNDLDFMIHWSYGIDLFINDGSMTFTNSPLVSGGFKFEVIDLDNDSMLDLITIGSYYIQEVSGIYTLNSLNITGIWDVNVADYDNDNDLDAVVTVLNTKEVIFVENTTNTPTPQSIATALDAYMDAVDQNISRESILQARFFMTQISDEVKVLMSKEATYLALEEALTNADNVIELINTFSDPVLEPEVTAARLAYNALTDNGKALVTNYDLLLQAEVVPLTLTAASFSLSLIQSGVNQAEDAIRLADFNKDGYIDFVTTTANDIKIYLNDGDNTFTLSESFGSSVAKALEIGDINKDGYIDIVTKFYAASYISILTNDTTGKFVETTSEDGSANLDAYAIRIADIDFNGFDDIIVSVASRFSLNIHYGSESGYTTDLAGQTNFNSFVFIDIDDDLDMDIVGVSFPHDTTYLLTNDNLVFTQTTLFTGLDGVLDVVAVDINDDAKMDLLISSYYSNKLSAFTNNGDGTFTETILVTGSTISVSTYGDIDNDGDMDYIAGGTDIYIGINKGDSVEKISLVSTPSRAMSVFLIDFDGDGNLDIFFRTESAIYLFTNLA